MAKERGMLIGYARAAKSGKELDIQKAMLDRAGVGELFVDLVCGAKQERQRLEQALLRLRKRDTLVVCRLDRLARSVQHVTELVKELSQRGIGVRSLEENIDTTTNMGKLAFQTLGKALAEVERTIMRERTMAGRAAAKVCNRRAGRKPKLDERKRAQVRKLYADRLLSHEEICRKFQISRSTFFRLLHQANKNKPGKRSDPAKVVASPRAVATASSRPTKSPSSRGKR